MLHSFTEEGRNVADPKCIFFMLCISALESLCIKGSSKAVLYSSLTKHLEMNLINLLII